MTDAFDRLTKALSDRYTIERELGAGGMATVYFAHEIGRRSRKPCNSSTPWYNCKYD